MKNAWFHLSLGVLCLSCTGCGSGLEKFPLVKTTGVVLCQGKPVPNAMVYFEPVRGGEDAGAEMILQFAHFLGEEYRRDTGHEAAVHVLALASLNGRKPVLMIDPNVDLMAEQRGFYQREWLLPQNEPLRYPHWDAPPEQWRQYVDIPELRFISRSDSPATANMTARAAKSGSY